MNNKTILIADDDSEIVKLSQIILERSDFNVITAFDGRTALKKIIQQSPDLIVLDIEMPEMNGFEVLDEIKNNPVTKVIPVIMLTGRTKMEDVDKVMEKKADWYIAKPFRNTHLLEKVECFLKKP